MAYGIRRYRRRRQIYMLHGTTASSCGPQTAEPADAAAEVPSVATHTTPTDSSPPTGAALSLAAQSLMFTVWGSSPQGCVCCHVSSSRLSFSFGSACFKTNKFSLFFRGVLRSFIKILRFLFILKKLHPVYSSGTINGTLSVR